MTKSPAALYWFKVNRGPNQLDNRFSREKAPPLSDSENGRLPELANEPPPLWRRLWRKLWASPPQ